MTYDQQAQKLCALVAAVGSKRQQPKVSLAELLKRQVGKLVQPQLKTSVLAVVLCYEIHISAEDSKALRKLVGRVGLAMRGQECSKRQLRVLLSKIITPSENP